MDIGKNIVEIKAEFIYEDRKDPSLNILENKISRGKCIVLCGSSGCGKTTLLRCINQLIPQFYEGVLKGFCRINGCDTKDLSIGETGKFVASVFQDPRSQFFTLDSTSELAFGLENFGVSREEIIKRVSKAFDEFNLGYLKDRNVFTLSSGERQLIAILAAWVLDTELFLLDEPTANLDFQGIQQLTEALRKLKLKNKTMIISEHRLYYLKDIADEYWYMENGQIIKKFTRDEMLQLSKEEREGMSLRVTDLDQAENAEKVICLNDEKEFIAKDISFTYAHCKDKVINNLSLNVNQGEILGLIGTNGCGKTTFGKLIAGLLKPDSGAFTYNGRPLSQKELEQHSIFIMQEAEFQFFTNSVMNELTYNRKTSKEDEEEIEQLLKAVGLWECRNRHPFSLSGGQMQKLVLLLAYLSPKPIVVLDEPTAGLDYGSLISFSKLIKKMEESKIVFIITHDLELISLVCTKVLAIKDGKIEGNFDLRTKENYQKLKKYMMNLEKPVHTPIKKEKVEPFVDPRVKLLLFALSMISAIGTDSSIIISTFVAVMLVYIYEHRWKPLLIGVISLGLTYMSYSLFPSIATAFIISFFPRIIITCFGAYLFVGKRDVTRSLAALRKLHVPESIIMIVSVMLRFFPVLSKDLKLMKQSIKTRGFFPRFIDKVKAIPEYIEILIVPMVFRVIRIAEALSASAETRGIALKNKRDSMIYLKFNLSDIVIISLSLLLFVAGIAL